MKKKLIKTSEVKKMVNIRSFSLLANLYKAGLFPKPVRIGKRQLLWHIDEVEQWMLHCPYVDCKNKYMLNNLSNHGYPLKFISIIEVRNITGISSPTTIYKFMREGSFPCRVQVTKRKVAWYEHEVLSWIEQQRKDV